MNNLTIGRKILDGKQIELRRARWIRGISRREMARNLGVPLAKYVYWECFPEQMPVSAAKRFAETVELPLDVIFFGPNSTLSRDRKRMTGEKKVLRKVGVCLLCGEPIEINFREKFVRNEKEKQRGAFEPVVRLFNGVEPFGNDGVCAECLTAHRAALESTPGGAAGERESLVDLAKYLVEQFGSDRREGIPWIPSR